MIPLVYLASHLFRLKVRDSYRDIRARLARINAYLQERITGIRIVQVFGREASEATRFDDLNRGHLKANLDSITYYALYFPVIEVLTSIALASLIVAGAHRVEIGTLTVGTVAAFLQLVRRFFQPLQDLSDKFNTLQQAMAASERVFRLLDEPEAVGLTAVGETARSTAATRRRGVRVEFEDVWFAYDLGHVAHDSDRIASPEWVLKGVSFTVDSGRTLALVGHTGAGKTTIISLLLRFYDPQRGRILVDGVDIREIPVSELRALIGYVQQDIFLFAGDVLTNIRLSNEISELEVAAAASRVGADRVIRRLPGGYQQTLGERGASISVGERQLLSFARAIAADPALLVLDEATSAVDSEIEAEIQAALTALMSGRTTIAVAHRLSTIVGADEILVLHHGQVRERGTHRELLARRGPLRALVPAPGGRDPRRLARFHGRRREGRGADRKRCSSRGCLMLASAVADGILSAGTVRCRAHRDAGHKAGRSTVLIAPGHQPTRRRRFRRVDDLARRLVGRSGDHRSDWNRGGRHPARIRQGGGGPGERCAADGSDALAPRRQAGSRRQGTLVFGRLEDGRDDVRVARGDRRGRPPR